MLENWVQYIITVCVIYTLNTIFRLDLDSHKKFNSTNKFVWNAYSICLIISKFYIIFWIVFRHLR